MNKSGKQENDDMYSVASSPKTNGFFLSALSLILVYMAVLPTPVALR